MHEYDKIKQFHAQNEIWLVPILTDSHFEEVGHVLQFSCYVGVENGIEALTASPKYWNDEKYLSE